MRPTTCAARPTAAATSAPGGRSVVVAHPDSGRRRTRLGGGVGGAVSVAALLAVLSRSVDNGWLFLLGCLVLGVVAAAVVTRPPLHALAVTVDAPGRATVGTEVVHRVTVRNTSGRDSGPVRVELATAGFGVGAAELVGLAAGAEETVEVLRPVRTRGVATEHCVAVSGHDALGLLRSRRHVHVAVELLVHPAPVPVVALPGAPRGAGPDVAGVRAFRPGDPASAVHWRSTARRGALVVLEREDDDLPRLALVVGLTPPAGTGGASWPAQAPGAEQWEVVLAGVASLVRREVAAGREVALFAVPADGSVEEARTRGPASAVALLDVVARCGAPGVVPVGLVRRARGWAGSGGAVFVACVDGAGGPVLVPSGAAVLAVERAGSAGAAGSAAGVR